MLGLLSSSHLAAAKVTSSLYGAVIGLVSIPFTPPNLALYVGKLSNALPQ